MDALSFADSTWFSQFATIGVLAMGLLLFIRDRFRYDVVALFLMIAIILLGILPYEAVLANFSDPTIVIVAAMFVLSSALVYSGIIDLIISRITFLYPRPVLSLAVLVILVTSISGFFDNLGALAIVMPIALHLAQKGGTPVAFYLLPIAFASHLGGYLTLIGTPRNIIISEYRAEATGQPFAMFDFSLIGGAIALVGMVFIIFYAWRFLPRTSAQKHSVIAREYITQVIVTPKAKVLNLTVGKVHNKLKGLATLEAILRNEIILEHTPDTLIHEDDILTLRGSEEALTLTIEKFHLQLVGLRSFEKFVTNADEFVSLEVVVPPYSKIVNRSWNDISLQDRFGTNFIGLFRKSFPINQLLSNIKIHGNDILLLRGRTESVMSTVNAFSLLPLANSTAHLGRTTSIIATLTIVIGAVVLASLAIAPLPIIFLCAVALLIGFNLISLRAVYDSIDWPVLVLLAGMLTLGDALVASGAATSLSQTILGLSESLSPTVLLIVVLVSSMLISDFINTTASAVVMGPVAIVIATGMGVSVDPFLMAVAIGASSAFLTPVGHESNALVMQKGGYRFSDFTKIGLPLELLIVVISIPLILVVWPF